MRYWVLKLEQDATGFEPITLQKACKDLNEATDVAISWVGEKSGRKAIVAAERGQFSSSVSIDGAVR
jgi:hypothetical protein